MKKSAMPLGTMATLAGVLKSYRSGKSMAGVTSNALSRRGNKVKNEEIARQFGGYTGVAGGIAGASLALKNLESVYNATHKHMSPGAAKIVTLLTPAAAAVSGGMLAGSATGAITSLRGRLFGKKKKEASFFGYAAGGAALGTGAGLLHGHLKNKKLDPNDPDYTAKKKKNLADSAIRGAGIGTAAGIGAGYAFPKIHQKRLNRTIEKNRSKYVDSQLAKRKATKDSLRWYAKPFVKSEKSVIKGSNKFVDNLKKKNTYKPFQSFSEMRKNTKSVKSNF